jgi:D-3-phosphoglycerate dehydrogenase
MKNDALPVALLSRQAIQNPKNLELLRNCFEVIYLDSYLCENESILSKVECIWIHIDFSLDENFLMQVPNCKFVLTTTTGLTHISLGAKKVLEEKLISLNDFMPELSSVTSTAELAISFLFHSQLNLDPIFSEVNLGNWSRESHLRQKQISSLAIGIVGLGRLGSIVARTVSALGAKVYFCEIQQERIDTGIANGYSYIESLQQLCEFADVVSIHANVMAEQRPIITSEILETLESKIVLINTARAILIDDVALIESMRIGKVTKYYTDVLRTEDLNQPLQRSLIWQESQTNRNIHVTPHIGGATVEAMSYCENLLLEKLLQKMKQ